MIPSHVWCDGFVIHSRPYRDTSLLLDLFTQDYGRIRAVAKGVRRSDKAGRGILQLFQPLTLQFYGKRDLLGLKQVDATGPAFRLLGKCLLSGLYLNELLVRTLTNSDGCLSLYQHYLMTLSVLSETVDPEPCLRAFEQCLLSSLGYGLSLSVDALSGETVAPDAYYFFEPDKGVTFAPGAALQQAKYRFLGAHLLAIDAAAFNEPAVRRDAKRLFRLALAPLLGHKPIKSRELFVTIGT